MKLLDRAIAELRKVHDPYARLREAEVLDRALVAARSAVMLIKRDTINSLRDHRTGYGTIAEQLGLTKGRVQQIANIEPRLVRAAYAFSDESGSWHGEPDRLDQYVDARLPNPFDPANKDNRFAGQTLVIRYGELPEDAELSAYGLTVLDGGNPVRVRVTQLVMRDLFE